jgi:LysM repeat protein
VVALVVRAALRSDSSATVTTQANVPGHASSGRASRPTVSPAKRYVIRSGDTLGAIAERFGTTVEALLRLNPGIEPTALTPGEQVRVR